MVPRGNRCAGKLRHYPRLRHCHGIDRFAIYDLLDLQVGTSGHIEGAKHAEERGGAHRKLESRIARTQLVVEFRRERQPGRHQRVGIDPEIDGSNLVLPGEDAEVPRAAGQASAALVVRIVEGLSVELASPAGTTVKAGTQVQLVAEVSGAAADAQLRYVWGLPDGDVETDIPTLDVTLAEPGVAAFGVTVFDDHHGEEADAIVEFLVQEVPPLMLAITDVPDVVPQGEVVTIRISIAGGLVEGADGEIFPYELTVDYGDGSTQEFVVTEPDLQIEHTYADADTYTLTVVATSPDGQRATVSAELGVRGAFTVVMVRPLREEFVVLANEVVIEVEGRTARVVAFSYQTEWAGYEGFTIDSAGNTQTFSVECVNHTTVEHQGDDLVYDPEAGTITGTINLLWTRLDVGNECPFGGIDDVQTRTADVDITIVDGQGSGRFLSEEALPRFTFVLEPKTN